MSWKEFHTVKDIEIETSKGTYFLMAEVCIEFERLDYGVDTDGRRGQMQDLVVDWDYEGIWDLDTGDDVTDLFKNDAALERAVMKGLVRS